MTATSTPLWDAEEVLVPSGDPRPFDAGVLRRRLVLTLFGLGQALLAVPALALFILTVLSLVLAPLGVGFALAHLVVPATQWLAGVHRRLAARVLGEDVPAGYLPDQGWGAVAPMHWARDPARWRDVGHLAFSATGGFVMSGLPAMAPAHLVTVLLGIVLSGHPAWWWLLGLSVPALTASWLFATPALIRARALTDRTLLGHGRVQQLQNRVDDVTRSRSAALDNRDAEIKRIERDLHDGAQARMTAVGLQVGMAEQLLTRDPEQAALLLRQARESTLTALADVRSLVRGIRPPALADHGLVGGVEALAASLPVPVTVHADVPGGLPSPVESAAYFAVAECLANLVKHADAGRGWVRLSHDGHRLLMLVGDDGRGGADPDGSGLAGVRHRLGAFDGTLTVTSPIGGPTTLRMEIPCG